jgi:hypothetical protein
VGSVTITGSGFVAGATVGVSGAGVTVSNVSLVFPTQLTATLTVGSGAAVGAHDVTVTNASGAAGTFTGGFTVLAAVTAGSMTPNQGPPGAAGPVTITGSGFAAGAIVSIGGAGVIASSVTAVSPTQLTATLTVSSSAPPGARNVTVTNAGGASGMLTSGFTVLAPVAVTSIAPTQGAPGMVVQLTITGSGIRGRGHGERQWRGCLRE